jgi:uncharacterized iron-regulated membrane protein
MMRQRLRRCWLTLHRWVGLSFGCVLIVAAITGSVLVLARPLDAAMHPELFRTSGTQRGSLQPIVSRLRDEFGPDAALNMRMPTHAGESLQVAISGPWSGTVYFDGESARELGRREIGEGFFNALFELHSSLNAGDTGRAVLAWAALAYCAMLMSGLVLWWPVRWDRAFSVRVRSGRALALLDLHRVAGAALGLLVLISVVTGVYMAWRPLAGWVTYLSGGPPAIISAPKPGTGPSAVSARVDAAVQRARDHWPHAVVSIVHVPPRSVAASRVRLRMPDDPHPIGMSTVWLDPLTGDVRMARHWSELDAGSRAFSIIYPLHTGGLYGLPTLLAAVVGGIALAGFGFSGIWLWWQRRDGELIRSTRASVGCDCSEEITDVK